MLGPLAGELDLCAAGIEDRRSGQRPCVHGATYSTWPRSDSAPTTSTRHSRARRGTRRSPIVARRVRRPRVRRPALQHRRRTHRDRGPRPPRMRVPRALGLPVGIIESSSSPARATTTTSTITSGGFALASSRRAGSSRNRARCTSTSIRASRTTARCCSMRSSDARASSTRWCGHMTTARARNDAGPRSTMSSSCTCKDPREYHFDASEVSREPYMAPKLQTPERAARGKLPTDVWWHTIVPTSSRERTGYPTQKPLGILRRIVAASSRPGDLVVDWCAGSGTTGCGCSGAGPPLSAHRQSARGDRGDAQATCGRARPRGDQPLMRWRSSNPLAMMMR